MIKLSSPSGVVKIPLSSLGWYCSNAASNAPVFDTSGGANGIKGGRGGARTSDPSLYKLTYKNSS